MLGQTKNFVIQRKETIKRQLQQNSIFNFCKPINIAAGKKLTLLMDEETIVLDKVNKQTPTIVVLNIEFFNQANNIYKSNKQCILDQASKRRPVVAAVSTVLLDQANNGAQQRKHVAGPYK